MAVSFFVNRLYVLTTEGKVAYDEEFHHGVNIIRGENSSGKSTITHLLFYGLGGEYTHFVNEVRQCSRVMVEVSIDGATLTLSRPIEQDADGRILSQRGMTIWWGSLKEVLNKDCEAQTFGYKTAAHTCSFSNKLFEVMKMPIVQGDNNITMHQLLRLLYIDQESPTQSLYYYEQFDSQTTRETAADLLMGIFDEKLYAAKLKYKNLEAELVNLKAEIRVLEKSLDPRQRSTEFILEEIAGKNREMEKLDVKIQCLRQGGKPDRKDKSQLEQMKSEVKSLETSCKEEEERIELLQYDIEDTQMFISELSRKKLALTHSVSTREILGTLRLEYCPECLSPLPQDTPDGTCHLCRQKIDNKSGVTQAKRLISELSFQQKESEEILQKDGEELKDAKAKLRSLKVMRKRAQTHLDELLGSARSTTAAAIEDLIYQKGELNGELQQFYTMLEMAEKYEQLKEQQEQTESAISQERCYIQAQLAKQESRRNEVIRKIQEHGAYFLNHDEARQKDFQKAQPSDLTVDFPGNMVFLRDRYSKYSASSAFFLKLAARFSLFFASLDIPWMRYPRFIFADNMEDKGIEQGRAQKFQQTLINSLGKYDTDTYQVIYTTSYITEALDHSQYVVGEHYDMEHKSLKNVVKK